MSTSPLWCCFCPLLLEFVITLVLALPILGMKSTAINGVAGESVVLHTGLGDKSHSILMQWKKDKNIIIQIKNKKTQVIMSQYKGRISVDEKTWSLTIYPARATDGGEYVFQKLNSAPTMSTILHVYERIVSVSVQSQVSYSPENTTCNVTLRCLVNGSVEMLSWKRDNREIPGVEGRETLTVSDSQGGVYSCTASNPVSSQTEEVLVNRCHMYVQETYTELYKFIGIGAGLVLIVMVIITLICYFRAKNKVLQDVDTVYAEIEELNYEDHQKNIMCSKSATGNTTTCYDTLQSTAVIPTGPFTLYDTVNFTRPITTKNV
ncbi:SLAM family member 5-like [Scleropages formosus]|uniref:SLAM family member 5-like n=1 Tax=Scleropages formosus TaxID=113540 RepID=UPI0010FABDB1|nr:T-lymphocyte surface antigen Ly-9 [Scleropages formosus]